MRGRTTVRTISATTVVLRSITHRLQCCSIFSVAALNRSSGSKISDGLICTKRVLGRSMIEPSSIHNFAMTHLELASHKSIFKFIPNNISCTRRDSDKTNENLLLESFSASGLLKDREYRRSHPFIIEGGIVYVV